MKDTTCLLSNPVVNYALFVRYFERIIEKDNPQNCKNLSLSVPWEMILYGYATMSGSII